MTPVSGLTHNFYRYPARFSPKFVRAAIEAFSSPGDLVLDPFMGGGTTLVEALATGRHAVGSDISTLAAFVAEAKTTIYSDGELALLSTWATHATTRIDIHRPEGLAREYKDSGYLRYLRRPSTWRLRKAIAQLLASVTTLPSPKLEIFARCVVLRAAQWALDGRKKLPSISDFRATFTSFADDMIGGARELRAAVTAGSGSSPPIAHCLTRPTAGLEREPLLKDVPKPRLVITSPPYPGVHVLYHRWQVDGGKETPAPFWVANKLDGSGAAYYTMGDRGAAKLRPYFNQLRQSLRSIAAVSDDETTIVQVVAFAEPRWQLPKYLAAAESAGLREIRLRRLKSKGDERLWRTVPNRKWYADQRGTTSGSQEVVLFHRKR
jgi:hypothetical protein